MKKTTKNRIVMATGGLLLTTVSAFLTGGLTVCIVQIVTRGLQPPEKFGWLGAFIIGGIFPLVVTWPALLLMTIISIIKCLPLKLRILFNIINTFIISVISLIVIAEGGYRTSYSSFVGVVSLIIIIIFSEYLFRNKFKTKLEE